MDEFESMLGKIGLLLFAFNVVVFCVPYYFCGPLECYTEHSTTETYQLVSAVDTKNITGQYNASGFFVFYSANGELDNQKFYNVFYQLTDGGIKQYEIPVNEASIYYIENDEVPYLEITSFYDCNGIDRKTSEHDIKQKPSRISYNIYVPEGSIIEQFQFTGG